MLTQRAKKNWLIAGVVTAVVVIAFAAVALLTGGSGDSAEPIRSTQASTTTSVPETTTSAPSSTLTAATTTTVGTPVPHLPSGQSRPPTPIGGFNFRIDNNWQVVDRTVDAAGLVTKVNQTGVCPRQTASTNDMGCPGFVVVEGTSPFASSDAPGKNTCQWTGVVDNLHYKDPKPVETYRTDTVIVQHDTVSRCDISTGEVRAGGDVMHVWHLKELASTGGVTKREAVVFDINVTSGDPLPGLPDLLMRVAAVG